MPRFFHAILAYSVLFAVFAQCGALIDPPYGIRCAPTYSTSTESHPDSVATLSSRYPTAAIVAFSPTAAPPDNELKLPVQFTLIDGTRISGTLADWNESSFTGTFGKRHWHEITYRDGWRILYRLIDRDIPDDWLLIGRIMLQISLDQPDAEDWSERAFRHARRVAGGYEREAIEKRIQEIVAEHEAKKQAQARREHDLDPSRLRTRTPEADDWPAAPWPELTRNEQRNAVLTKKQDARQALAAIDLEIEPIETANVLIYTDLDRYQAVRIATQLDGILRELALILHKNPRANPFWGKAVLIILTDRDQYDRLQTDAFGYHADFDGAKAGIFGTVPGVVHPIGPKVFITIHHPGLGRQHEFQLELARLLVRGILHRHITPRRLPPWANDGLGMVVADRLYYDDSPIVQRRRSTELSFLRQMDDDLRLRDLIAMGYDDERWPAWEWRLAALGGLFVELMIREKPREFVRWVEAIKRGADWREALTEIYGVPLDTLLSTAVRYYRVND